MLALCYSTSVFQEDIPFELIEKLVSEIMPANRDRIFTPRNVFLTMLLSATKEDTCTVYAVLGKSLQAALNMFKLVFEHNCQKAFQAETRQLEQEKEDDNLVKKGPGRPKKYQSSLPKSHQKPLSNSTAGFSIARKKLDTSIVHAVYEHSSNFGNLENESWYGLKSYTCTTYEVRVSPTAHICSCRIPMTLKGNIL